MKRVTESRLFGATVARWLPNSVRGKVVLRNTGAAFVARVSSAICLLLQVPIAFHYLGATEFGLWATLTSILGLLAIADFGVGYGIQNGIAEALGRDDERTIASLIVQGIYLLLAVSLAIGAILSGILFATPWTHAFAKDAAQAALLQSGAKVLLAVFCLNLPLVVFQRAAVGLQKVWLSSSCVAVSSVLTLVLVATAGPLHLGFAGFVAAAALPPLLLNIVLAVCLGGNHLAGHPVQGPSWAAISSLLKQGLPFTVPQIGAIALQLWPPLTIASIAGPEAIALYTVAQRFLLLFAQCQGLLMLTLWPAFTEARARGEIAWVRTSYVVLWKFTAGLIILPQLLFPLWGPVVIHLWIGPLQLSTGLLVAMAIQAALTSSSQPPATLLNSMGKMAGQASYGFATVVLILVTLPWGIHRWGLTGAPIIYLFWFGLINVPFVTIEAGRALKLLRPSAKTP